MLGMYTISTEAMVTFVGCIGGGFTALWMWAKRQNDKHIETLHDITATQLEILERVLRAMNDSTTAVVGMSRAAENNGAILEELRAEISKLKP